MHQVGNCCLLIALALATSLPAVAGKDQEIERQSDVLVPQKGHLLYGAFRSATNQEVMFQIDAGQSLTLHWKDVKELQVHQKTTIRTEGVLSGSSSKSQLELDTVTIQQVQEQLTVTSAAKILTFSLKNLVSLSTVSSDRASTSPSTVWTGSVTGKGSLVAGTQTQQTLGAQIYLRRNQNLALEDWHHQVTTLILEANNSLTEQVGSPTIRTHTYDALLTHQIYVWKGLYLDGVADAYHNSSLNLYLQQSYGGGFGKNLYKGKRNTLEAKADFLYIAEHFYGAIPSVGFAGVRLHEGYTFAVAYIKDSPLSLAQTASYTPAFNETNAWQARGGVTLSVPLSKTFSATLSFSDNYLENAPNARKNYATSSIGLTYTLPLQK